MTVPRILSQDKFSRKGLSLSSFTSLMRSVTLSCSGLYPTHLLILIVLWSQTCVAQPLSNRRCRCHFTHHGSGARGVIAHWRLSRDCARQRSMTDGSDDGDFRTLGARLTQVHDDWTTSDADRAPRKDITTPTDDGKATLVTSNRH